MSKRYETLLYSTVGVIALAVVLLLANFVLGAFKQRIDLTEGRVYTLSDGTRAVLSQLTGTVRLRFYFSRADANMPLPLKAYGRRVEDLLAEFKSAGKGKIIVEKVDPQPDSDAEESANLDSVQAQQLPSGDKFYLGLAVSFADQRVAIPALTLDREPLLEYDVVRAITRAATVAKPVVGVMSALPLFGGPGNPRAGVPPSEKQVFVSELERDYQVKRIALDTDSIDKDVKVLVVVHPRNLSERTQYALDQYVMRGGRLIAMLDPFSYVAASTVPAPEGTAGSTLEPLLKAWGIGFDPSKVLQDTQYMSGEGQRALPGVLSLVGAAFNSQDVSTNRLGSALLPFAGVFTGKAAPGLTQTVLLKSSKYSRLIPSADSTKSGDEALRDFKATEAEQTIALKLSGKFKTAFPSGAPAAPLDPAKQFASTPVAPPAPQIKESADNVVALIGDSDFINDGAAVQIQNIFGQRTVIPANGNLAFAQALVEQFAGDDRLILLRSRAIAARPFTVLRNMEARAQQAYIGKISALQATLQETTQKLQALQQQRGTDQQNSTILTPAQQAEIEKFRKTSADARRELKDVRKALRADSQALEF